MCRDCGCSPAGKTPEELASDRSPRPAGTPGHQHGHPHHHHHGPHDHGHDNDHHTHDHAHPHDPESEGATQRRVLDLHQSVLAKNDHLAMHLRQDFQKWDLLVVNLLSSPGSGKTTLLVKTLQALRGELKVGVIVGDLATDNDAQRLRATGAPVVQVTTGTVCHLDATMVSRALGELNPADLNILFIENVGNLVCPAAFDLGEKHRVVLLSVTEGEDKPVKYPTAFLGADLVLISKSDLSEAVEFDRPVAMRNIHQASPHAEVLDISARTGAGINAWMEWLRARIAAGAPTQ